jgi:hypothetical protein
MYNTRLYLHMHVCIYLEIVYHNNIEQFGFRSKIPERYFVRL